MENQETKEEGNNIAPKKRKAGGVPFVKGDPRCWRKGRPKSFDALRALAQEVLAEASVTSKDGDKSRLILIRIPLMRDGKPVVDEKGEPVMIDHYATNAEMIVRQMMKDGRRQAAILEIAYGKVPQAVELTGKGGGPVQTQAVPPDMEAMKRMVKEKVEELARLEMERESLDVSEGGPK